MAGHKGYGLGLWAEILAAVLPGGAMTWQVGSWIFDEPSKPSRHNAAFVAIDVATIAPPDEFAAGIQALIDEIHAVPTASGVKRVLVPGEREGNLRRQAILNGIALPEDVQEKLRLVARDSGLKVDWLKPSKNAVEG